jgi:hypothetical protein
MSARPVGQQQLAGQTVVVLGASSFDLKMPEPKMPEPVHGQVVEWWMASPWLR